MTPPLQIPVPTSSKEVSNSSEQNSDNDDIKRGFAPEVNEIIITKATQSIEEGHQERLSFIRSKLRFLEETEWMYQPIDKLLGNSHSELEKL